MTSISRKFGILLAVTLTLAGSICLRAQTSDDLRFVFLIDVSPRMAARQDATVRTVQDLIRTGFHDRIQPGERFALWFYDQAIYTNFPVFVWDSTRGTELANEARQLFSLAPRPGADDATAALTSAPSGLGRFPRLMALILTDGYRPIKGTPFDFEINAALASRRDRFTRAKKPFLIALQAHNGQWVSYTVHTNIGAAIELPPILPDRSLIEEATALVRAASSETVPPANPPPAPSVAQVEKPALREPITTPPPVEEKPAPKRTEPEVNRDPTPASAEVKKLEAPPKPDPIPTAAVEAPREETAAAAAPVNFKQPEPSPEAAPRVEPAQVEPAKIEEPTVAAPLSQPAAEPPLATVGTSSTFPWTTLILSLFVIAAATAVIYLKSRGPRKSASLISQSLGPPKFDAGSKPILKPKSD